MSAYVVTFWILVVSTFAAALRWGGWAERTAGSLYLIATIASLALWHPSAARYQHVEIGVLAIDVGLLVGLAVIAYRTKPLWPIVAASLQAIATLAHFAKAVNPGFWRLGYAIMSGVSAYPTQILLAIAIWQHHRSTRPTASRRSPP